MATKELVFELSEGEDLRLGFVCPKCNTETVYALTGERPFHQCPKDNNSYPDEKGKQIFQAFGVALSDLMKLKPPVRLRVTIPQ